MTSWLKSLAVFALVGLLPMVGCTSRLSVEETPVHVSDTDESAPAPVNDENNP